MTQRTMTAPLETLADVERPTDFEMATLTRHDIPALAELQVAAYRAPDTPEAMWEATDELRMTFDGAFGEPKDDSFIGVWHEGILVGALLAVTHPAWDIDNEIEGPVVLDLMVNPEFRRQGIAKALVGEIARRCVAWGEDSLSLRLEPHHSEASSLYDVLGFQELA